MRQYGFRIIPQDKFPDSVLIQKYTTLLNQYFPINHFYLDWADIPSLTKLLLDTNKNAPAPAIKEEVITKTKEEYYKQREVLIIEERYEEVILLDKAFKHFK